MPFISGPNNTRSKQKTPLWKPGQSGNPAGRPLGRKNKFSGDFWAALQQEWELRGADALNTVCKYRPEVYVKIIASLVIREDHPSEEIRPYEYSDEEIGELIEMIQAARREHPK